MSWWASKTCPIIYDSKGSTDHQKSRTQIFADKCTQILADEYKIALIGNQELEIENAMRRVTIKSLKCNA